MRLVKKGNTVVKTICMCLTGAVFAGCVSGPFIEDNAEERRAGSEQIAGSMQTGVPGQNDWPAEDPGDPAELDGSSYEARGRIPTWKDGKEAACSLTLDDGSADQFILAAPVLETHGVGGSFFLMSGPRDREDQASIQAGLQELRGGQQPDVADLPLLFSWENAAALLKRGHEIGSRGKDPSDPTNIGGGMEAVGRELLNSAREIRNKLPAEFLPPVGGLTFGWSGVEMDPALKTVAEESYLAGRGGQGLSSGPIIKDPFIVPSVRVGGTDSFPSWVRTLEMNSQRRGWMVFTFHGFAREVRRVSESGRQPVAIGKLEALLHYLSERSYWTAPFGRVYRYAVERHNSRLVFKEISDDGIVLSLDDGLDDAIYSEALTVEVLPPADMEVDTILSEDGDLIPFSTVSKGWIRFETVPDGRPLFLSIGK